MDNLVRNNIEYQHPRFWLKFHTTMTSTVRSLRLAFRVKRRAKVITASAAVYNLQPGNLSS